MKIVFQEIVQDNIRIVNISKCCVLCYVAYVMMFNRNIRPISFCGVGALYVIQHILRDINFKFEVNGFLKKNFINRRIFKSKKYKFVKFIVKRISVAGKNKKRGKIIHCRKFSNLTVEFVHYNKHVLDGIFQFLLRLAMFQKN